MDHVRAAADVVRLDVSARERRRTFLMPFDRAAPHPHDPRPVHVRRRHAAARTLGLLAHTFDTSTPLSAVRADVALLPHQFEAALAMARGARRVLITDEVGLGKTIQAGIVVAEHVRRNPASRVLIIVPGMLAAQWRNELHGRFEIDARMADSASLDRLATSLGRSESPWLLPGVWITSADFIKQTHVSAGLPPRAWDLLVIDEAHTAAGSSERHRACHQLAQMARQLLLLTATPHAGDPAAFERLISLGTLPTVDDPLTILRRTRASIGLAIPRRVRWPRVHPSPAQRRALDALLAFDRAILDAAGAERRDAARLLISVFRKRAASTVAALAMSVTRRLAWLDAHDVGADDGAWRQASLDFGDHTDVLDNDDAAALSADTGMNAETERVWLRRLAALCASAVASDAKLRRLVRLAARTREPLIVFTEFRHSLEVIVRALERVRAVAFVHGGQSASERDDSLAAFLAGHATVLVATDVAGQGLNLQAASRWIVSLELPWNPTRIEQRIGRVDRIGQHKAVHASLLTCGHAVEAPVLRRLAQRAVIVRASIDDSLLEASAPPEADVRAAVFGDDGELPAATTQPTPVCRRWSRPARCLVGRLAMRRTWLQSWRGPMPEHGRPHVTNEDASTWIFNGSILDGAGTEVERHAIAVANLGQTGREFGSVATMLARSAALRRLEMRARRLRRRMARISELVVAREQAIGDVLAAARAIRETQPGLFDRRELDALESVQDAVTEIERHAALQSTSIRNAAEIHVGPLALAVALGRPR